ncbi:MAG: M28 family peptidase [Acidobacteria bacterium]|nr:M28 family peptidase [Acidobacteriota bacterium]
MAAASTPIRLPLRDDVDARVEELLRNIAQGCHRLPNENHNQANQRIAQEFLAHIQRDFPGQCLARRQRIPTFHLRTTDANYIFTVAGRSPEEIVLVAHYDTWRGPGADDNTTGEEILKQYLLEDLRRSEPPPFTHTYVLAGSEECGLIGFLSQCLLAAGLVAANLAYQAGNFAIALLMLLTIPLAKYRIGVAGSRVYVRSLTEEQLARTKAVLAVDSVGEGKIYIPCDSLGADLVRAFIPFPGYDRLNSLLEEAAHLHHIKYNTFLSGGTTDHVSWLEVNNGLRDRLWERLGAEPKRKVPAAALIAMCPGKASPFVFGGKIHTPDDTPDRVYAGPLRETLQIVDYFFHALEGGSHPVEPRKPHECHYARLYQAGEETFLVLKDAVEPNRRNINVLYPVDADISGSVARVRIRDVASWGVETSLDQEIQEFLKGKSSQPAADPPVLRRIPVTEVHIENGPTFWRRFGLIRSFRAIWHHAVGSVEEWAGRYSFAVFFLSAYLIAEVFNVVMNWAFGASAWLAEWFFRLSWVTIPATVALEFAVIAYLFAVEIPTRMDNSYKHLNKADNLLSLKRARHA